MVEAAQLEDDVVQPILLYCLNHQIQFIVHSELLYQGRGVYFDLQIPVTWWRNEENCVESDEAVCEYRRGKDWL